VHKKKEIMLQFGADLLTILVLISLSLAGVTFIAVLIFLIIYIFSCLKRRRSKSIKPIPTHSTKSSVAIDDHSPSISPIPIKTPVRSSDQHKKSEQKIQRYDTFNITNEHPFGSHNNKNRYQQQEYIHDENDETTTINESRIYDPYHQKRQYQSFKPTGDLRIIDRHTPYPPDVIAREKLMQNIRFPTENKF
jgi:hypothetical protein